MEQGSDLRAMYDDTVALLKQAMHQRATSGASPESDAQLERLKTTVVSLGQMLRTLDPGFDAPAAGHRPRTAPPPQQHRGGGGMAPPLFPPQAPAPVRHAWGPPSPAMYGHPPPPPWFRGGAPPYLPAAHFHHPAYAGPGAAWHLPAPVPAAMHRPPPPPNAFGYSDYLHPDMSMMSPHMFAPLPGYGMESTGVLEQYTGMTSPPLAGAAAASGAPPAPPPARPTGFRAESPDDDAALAHTMERLAQLTAAVKDAQDAGPARARERGRAQALDDAARARALLDRPGEPGRPVAEVLAEREASEADLAQLEAQMEAVRRQREAIQALTQRLARGEVGEEELAMLRRSALGHRTAPEESATAASAQTQEDDEEDALAAAAEEASQARAVAQAEGDLAAMLAQSRQAFERQQSAARAQEEAHAHAAEHSEAVRSMLQRARFAIDGAQRASMGYRARTEAEAEADGQAAREQEAAAAAAEAAEGPGAGQAAAGRMDGTKAEELRAKMAGLQAAVARIEQLKALLAQAREEAGGAEKEEAEETGGGGLGAALEAALASVLEGMPDGQGDGRDARGRAGHQDTSEEQAEADATFARLQQLRAQNAEAQQRVNEAHAALAALHAAQRAQGGASGGGDSASAFDAGGIGLNAEALGLGARSESADSAARAVRPSAPTPHRMAHPGAAAGEAEDEDEDKVSAGDGAAAPEDELLNRAARAGATARQVEAMAANYFGLSDAELAGLGSAQLSILRSAYARSEGGRAQLLRALANVQQPEAPRTAEPLSPATLAASRPWATEQLYERRRQERADAEGDALRRSPTDETPANPAAEESGEESDEDAEEEGMENIKQDIGRMLAQLAGLRAAIAAQRDEADSAAQEQASFARAARDAGMEASGLLEAARARRGQDQAQAAAAHAAEAEEAEAEDEEATQDEASLLATGKGVAHRELDDVIGRDSTTLLALLQLLRTLGTLAPGSARRGALLQAIRTAAVEAGGEGSGVDVGGDDTDDEDDDEDEDDEDEDDEAGPWPAGLLYATHGVGGDGQDGRPFTAGGGPRPGTRGGDNQDGRPLTAGGGPRPASAPSSQQRVGHTAARPVAPTITISSAVANAPGTPSAHSGGTPARSPASTASYDYAEDVEDEDEDDEGARAPRGMRPLPPWLEEGPEGAMEAHGEGEDDLDEDDGGVLSPETNKFRERMRAGAAGRPKTARGPPGVDPFHYVQPTGEERADEESESQVKRFHSSSGADAQTADASTGRDDDEDADGSGGDDDDGEDDEATERALIDEMLADEALLAQLDDALSAVDQAAPRQPLEEHTVSDVGELVCRMLAHRYEEEDRHLNHAAREIVRASGDLLPAALRERVLEHMGQLLHDELVYRRLSAKVEASFDRSLRRLREMRSHVREHLGALSDVEVTVAAQLGMLERQRAQELHRLKRERLERLYQAGDVPDDAISNADTAQDEASVQGSAFAQWGGSSVGGFTGVASTAADGEDEDADDSDDDERAGASSWHVEEKPDSHGDPSSGDYERVDEDDDEDQDDSEDEDEDDIDEEDMDDLDMDLDFMRATTDGSASAYDEFEAQLEAAIARDMAQSADEARAQFESASHVLQEDTRRQANGGGAPGMDLRGLSQSQRMAQYAISGGGQGVDALASFMRAARLQGSDDDSGEESEDDGLAAALGADDDEEISTNARTTLESLRAAFRGLHEAHAAILAEAEAEADAAELNAFGPRPTVSHEPRESPSAAGVPGANPAAATAQASHATVTVDDLPTCLRMDEGQVGGCLTCQAVRASSPTRRVQWAERAESRDVVRYVGTHAPKTRETRLTTTPAASVHRAPHAVCPCPKSAPSSRQLASLSEMRVAEEAGPVAQPVGDLNEGAHPDDHPEPVPGQPAVRCGH